MRSKKVSIIIGLIILVINVLLLTVYLQRQGEHTFGFIKSLYEEIKAYRIVTLIVDYHRISSVQEARFSTMRVPVFLRELWTVTMLTSI